MIEYMHFRNLDAEGKILPHGGATFAYRNIGDNLQYSFCICASVDNFNRRIGRAISGGRLEKGRYAELPVRVLGDFGSLREAFTSLHELGINNARG